MTLRPTSGRSSKYTGSRHAGPDQRHFYHNWLIFQWSRHCSCCLIPSFFSFFSILQDSHQQKIIHLFFPCASLWIPFFFNTKNCIYNHESYQFRAHNLKYLYYIRPGKSQQQNSTQKKVINQFWAKKNHQKKDNNHYEKYIRFAKTKLSWDLRREEAQN